MISGINIRCRWYVCALYVFTTPSFAFRHFPPNSARIGYATDRAFFISGQLSTDAVSAPRKVWVLIKQQKQHSVQHARKHEVRPPQGE